MVSQVGEGHWRQFRQSPQHLLRLEKVAGMLYLCTRAFTLEDNDEPDIIPQIV